MAGRVSVVPSLQLSIIISLKIFLAVPFKTLEQFFSAKVVGGEIKIAIDNKNLDLTLVENLGENLSWLGAIEWLSVPGAILKLN